MSDVPKPDQARGRLLGIDHGSKVAGIALCDALQMIARPLQLLTRTTRERDFAAINALINTHGVVGIVVGLPEVPDGFDGISQVETVQRWAARLAANVTPPIYLWEETFSTLEATRLLEEAGFKRRARVDDVAAAVILQSFIDAHPPGKAHPPPVKAGRHS